LQSVRGTCPDRSNDSRQKSAPFAERTGLALIEAQHPSGGWNYIHDFAGETSLREWYANVGANGWRLEEFQHYYGNATFDDAGTAVSSQFMLRMYLFADRVMTSPVVSATDVVAVMDKLDPKGYWLTPLSAVTNPYKGVAPPRPTRAMPTAASTWAMCSTLRPTIRKIRR
jgi:hypothetical protein